MDEFELESCVKLKRYAIKHETFTPMHILVSECFDKRCIILWNDFYIHLYDSDAMNESPIVYCGENKICDVKSVHNILLALDENNVVNFTILRREDRENKPLMDKIKFKQIFEGVRHFIVNKEKIGFLQFKEQFWFNLYKIIGTSKFKIDVQYKLDTAFMSQIENYATIKLYMKPGKHFSRGFIKNVFNCDSIGDNVLFIVKDDEVSYQSLKEGSQTIRRIYSTPVSITEAGFDETGSKLFLSLVTGSVIILSTDMDHIHIKTIHLNCRLDKIIIRNDCFVYTDSDKVWQSTLNENDILKHKQLQPKSVYDIYIDETNTAYYTTLYNSIYVNQLDKHCVEQPNDFVKLSKSLKETKDSFSELLAESERNENVLNAITYENRLITIMALKHKPQFVANELTPTLTFYDDPITIKMDNLLCTTEIDYYYKSNTNVLIIGLNISPALKKKIAHILQYKILHVNVAIKFKNETRNVCINSGEFCSDRKIAVPLPRSIITFPAILSLKLITLIPDPHNEDIINWYLLPSKPLTMGFQYFSKISTTEPILTNVIDKIINVAKIHTKLVCDINPPKKSEDTVSYYVRVPVNIDLKELANKFVAGLNEKSAQDIAAKFTDDFKYNGSSITLSILGETVIIGLISGSCRKMKITSTNADVCYSAYSYVRDLFNFEDSDKFVPHFDFMRLQRIKDNIEAALSEVLDKNILLKLSEEYRSDILGILPH